MSYIQLIRGSHQLAVATHCALAAGALVLSATTPSMAGCNSGNAAHTDLLNSANCQAHAGSGGTAAGQDATAGLAATAFGNTAYATTRAATAVGFGAGFPNKGFTVAEGATMLGALAGFKGAGFYSTAAGSGASAAGAYSIALGGARDVVGELPAAKAQGLRSIAIGHNTFSADFGTSVGFATTTAFASTAIGTDAKASGDSSSALGRFSEASAHSSLALGVAAVASKPRSVAIGSGSVANVSNTVSVGTFESRRRIVNVATALGNSDAPTWGQVKGLVAAAAQSTIAAQAEIASASASTSMMNDIRRELSDLRALVSQQQHEITQLRSRNSTAALE